MKKNIALIFGGKSAEHEVSINSAQNILKALDTELFTPFLIGISKQGSFYQFANVDIFKKYKSLNDFDLTNEELISLISYKESPYVYSLKSKEKTAIDCAFPIVHGTMGEDGTLQGLLKIVNLPFVGCSVLSSAVSMDKEYTKRLITDAGILNSKYLVLKKNSEVSYSEIVQKLGTPFFIKPANAGSSVGVHKIKTETDWLLKLKDAFLYDHKVIAEEYIDGKEIECSVLGLNENPKVSLPGELIVSHEFYSYEAKYIDANGAQIVIPAEISADQVQKIQNLALKTFQTLGCDGLARVDFFLKKNGQIYVNEINTLPGFTQISMYPKMWEASGLSYSKLISELIHLAFQKFSVDQKLKLHF